MHPTRPHSIINELSGHASLLLSASPTIINSPLQNNTNNTSASSNTTNPNTNHPNTTSSSSTPTATITNSNHCSDDELPDDNINFKKPQNEIFRKLDGKIQSIMAAHSNFNKLYALNDFSSVGPRKPFELPPPLPRPPPWVPKISSDYGCSKWAEETLNNLNRVASEDADNNVRQSTSGPGPNIVTRVASKGNVTPSNKGPVPTIDSAISKLHQRRQQQQIQALTVKPQQMKQHRIQVPQAQPRISQQAQKIHQLEMVPAPMTPEMHLAKNILIAAREGSSDKLKTQLGPTGRGALNAIIEMDKFTQQYRSQQNDRQSKGSTGPTSISSDMTPEERRKFQIKLINIFTQEIQAATRLAKVNFPKANERPRIADQKSLLLKKSPQSLFNTIRHETSLLLNRKDPNRSGISMLNEQQSSSSRLQSGHNFQTPYRPINRYNTVKVVVPPTEFFKHVCGKQPSGKGNSENLECSCLESKAQLSNVDEWCPPRQFSLKYRNLQMKLYQLKYIQKRDELNRRRGISISMFPADARKNKPNPQKSLDKIVDRLQARCHSSNSSSPTNSGSQPKSSSQDSQEKTTESTSSASPKASQSYEISLSPPMSPKPIPVYRSALTSGKSGSLAGSGSMLLANNSKVASQKMKKAKRLHHLGLRLNSYMDKDHPQPTTEKITLDQFAKCLNLVRSNDASLRRHQEKLMQSEIKWRIPMSDRPVRLRRIHGEKVRMPVSASYRATRKVGLQ
jgi:hypothetical protein